LIKRYLVLDAKGFGGRLRDPVEVWMAVTADTVGAFQQVESDRLGMLLLDAVGRKPIPNLPLFAPQVREDFGVVRQDRGGERRRRVLPVTTGAPRIARNCRLRRWVYERAPIGPLSRASTPKEGLFLDLRLGGSWLPPDDYLGATVGEAASPPVAAAGVGAA
jgi:hypothetical protein